MPRTTADKVVSVLGRDYDGESAPDLTRYVTAANLVTTRLAAKAVAGGYTHTSAELVEIESWLAAHFYTKSDPVYSQRSTNRASGSFVRNPKRPEPYLDGAVMLDGSGMLSGMLAGKRVGIDWLGKTDTERLTYEERN
jgi:hypothetical protein